MDQARCEDTDTKIRPSRAVDEAHLSKSLLDWFAQHKRDLPWRPAMPHGAPRPAYPVWVAEVMLQQTQVATVIPYYRAFMERFPGVRHLAAAEQDEVLKAWEGLGYYARARNLHRAARQVLSHHGGRVPCDRVALRALPGIGDYIANAILSLACGQDVAALEANGRRVVARLYAVRDPVDQSSTVRVLQDLANALLPAGHAGAFNEALMDLGSLVCVPRHPLCARCPLREDCQAYQMGITAEVPVRRPRQVVPHYDVTAAVIWRDGRLLLAQRPDEAMLGGLWEFPGGKCKAGESLPECLRREIEEELALDIDVGEPLVTVQHAYSHMRITLYAYHCRYTGGEPRAIGVQDFRWVTPAEIASYPLSAADLSIAAALLEKPGPSPEASKASP